MTGQWYSTLLQVTHLSPLSVLCDVVTNVHCQPQLLGLIRLKKYQYHNMYVCEPLSFETVEPYTCNSPGHSCGRNSWRKCSQCGACCDAFPCYSQPKPWPSLCHQHWHCSTGRCTSNLHTSQSWGDTCSGPLKTLKVQVLHDHRVNDKINNYYKQELRLLNKAGEKIWKSVYYD